MRKKVSFIFQLIRKDNRILLIAFAVQIPVCVILPYIQLFLTKTLVAGIEKQYALHRYVVEIVCIFLLQLGLTATKEWMNVSSEWNRTFMVNSMLGPLDRKTMSTDYANVEGMAGQAFRQKALNAVYVFGQSAVPRGVSLLVNFLGLLFYGITVGACNAVVLFVVVLTTVAGYFLTKVLHKYELKQKEVVVETEKKMQYLDKEAMSLQAAREIRLYDMAGMLTSLYQQNRKQRMAIAKKIAAGKCLVNGGGSLLSCIRDLVAYFYLIFLVARGQITVSEFVLMVGLVSGLSGWLKGLMEDVGEIQKMDLYLEDYFAYLNMEETAGKEPTQKMTVCKAPRLELIQVGFRYEGALEDTLKEINLVIEAGEKLAIVGKNGAGKTTLIKLLAGFYRPTSGRILLDGVDITSYSREAYFEAISAVFQDILLLPVGILQNVSSRTSQETDRDRVLQSLEKAGLHEKVQKLPRGVDTPMHKGVRDDGIDLSGGEQQKVIIAKAVYKKADFLILDEPTAALDPVSESGIYQKYNELSQEMTALFISHRLSSTSFCDRIILLDEGKVIEQGNHKSLMEFQGEYWKMFTLQSRYYKEGEHLAD